MTARTSESVMVQDTEGHGFIILVFAQGQILFMLSLLVFPFDVSDSNHAAPLRQREVLHDRDT